MKQGGRTLDILKEKLISGAKALGIELDEAALQKFEAFTGELLEWNKVMNLTAITEPEQIAVKHYVDSLSLLKYADIKKDAKIADVGCGAGFPGVPVKIVREDISLYCIDSLGKRIKFLENVKEKLNFQQFECLHSRAEDAGRQPQLRGSFDYVFARAVAKLRVLAEYCIPLLKTGGAFIAMKAGDVEEEISEAKNAIKTLGGKIESVSEYTLPGTDIARTIIVISKIADTPAKYPRPSAKIAKAPL
nr:MAG: 16S rRNA (guanine(527)-N(7))-methyltransferase RsmG [[Clostridium] cellulosi]